MNILLIGSAGFIGTNLSIELSKYSDYTLMMTDSHIEYFDKAKSLNLNNTVYIESAFDMNTDFDSLLKNVDVVFHLTSTTAPINSNKSIPDEMTANITVTAKLLDSCIKNKIKKIVFISSGGTVYGKNVVCPIDENSNTYPICSYGIQKLAIEKLLYLYNYMYNIDYRIIRLSNPYGPYQRPNGKLGAITTFIYKAINSESIDIYGNGTVVRDFIYIDDAIKGIINIAMSDTKYKLYNLGSGYGLSLNEVIIAIEDILNLKLDVNYNKSREVDVPVNYLDISRYKNEFNDPINVKLHDGIKYTAEYLKKIII